MDREVIIIKNLKRMNDGQKGGTGKEEIASCGLRVIRGCGRRGCTSSAVSPFAKSGRRIAPNVHPVVILHQSKEIWEEFWAGIEIAPTANEFSWPCCYFAPNGFEAGIGAGRGFVKPMTPSPPINNETDAHSILSNIHSIKAQAAIVHAILEAFGRRFNREESGRLTHESSHAPSDMTKLRVCTGKLGSPSGVAALLPALRDHLGIARVLRDKKAVGLPTKEQGEAGRGGRAIDDLQVEEIVLGLGPRMGLNPFRMEAVLWVHGHGHDHFFKKGLPV